MTLWKTYQDSLGILTKEFKAQSEITDRVFNLIDECIDFFDENSVEDEYYRVCGVTLAKAKNLAIGIYCCILNGLAQEAGALLRPFIECQELLTYFRLDPDRSQKAIQGKLPSAGKRAQKISGQFKEFRNHLSEHAAHFSFSEFSLKHLFDIETMKIRKTQPALPEVLMRNIRDFFVHLLLLSREAVECIKSQHIENKNKLESDYDRLKSEGISIFELGKQTYPDK